MTTAKALAVKLVYHSEGNFDKAMLELMNNVINIVKEDPSMVATHCKHYEDQRTNAKFIEFIIDERIPDEETP